MTPLEWITSAAWTSIPVVGMSIFVWWLFKSIIRADSKEREIYAQIEAEERAKLAQNSSNASEAKKK